MTKTATSKLQRWGNSLAIRIPPAVVKSAGLKAGQPVEVSAFKNRNKVQVVAIGEVQLTLAQKLALFDPERHSGEAMATNELLFNPPA